LPQRIATAMNVTHSQCDAKPTVRIPNCRSSVPVDRYQIILSLVTEAHVRKQRVQHRYAAELWPECAGD